MTSCKLEFAYHAYNNISTRSKVLAVFVNISTIKQHTEHMACEFTYENSYQPTAVVRLLEQSNSNVSKILQDY